eukprot:358721-Chlamydomonas_euryale.AAC.1
MGSQLTLHAAASNTAATHACVESGVEWRCPLARRRRSATSSELCGRRGDQGQSPLKRASLTPLAPCPMHSHSLPFPLSPFPCPSLTGL